MTAPILLLLFSNSLVMFGAVAAGFGYSEGAKSFSRLGVSMMFCGVACAFYAGTVWGAK